MAFLKKKLPEVYCRVWYVTGCPSGDATVGDKIFYYGTENVYHRDGLEDCEARGLRVSSFETREEFDAIQGGNGLEIETVCRLII